MKSFLLEHPVILGGILPMFLFGLTAFPIKLLNGRLHTSYYMIFSGIGMFLVGILAWFLLKPEIKPLFSNTILAILNGALLGAAGLCIFLALSYPKTTLAQLAPIYNINTLIVVLIGIVFFAEWQQIVVWKILLGTVFILTGGWLVL